MQVSILQPPPIDGDIIERWRQFAFKIVEIEENFIRFVVKEIAGTHGSGGTSLPGAWLYLDSDNQFTSDFDTGEPFLSGSIKWDHCSNWDFHTDERMKHFCGRQAAMDIGGLMGELYGIAAQRIVAWDGLSNTN